MTPNISEMTFDEWWAYWGPRIEELIRLNYGVPKPPDKSHPYGYRPTLPKNSYSSAISYISPGK